MGHVSSNLDRSKDGRHRDYHRMEAEEAPVQTRLPCRARRTRKVVVVEVAVPTCNDHREPDPHQSYSHHNHYVDHVQEPT